MSEAAIKKIEPDTQQQDGEVLLALIPVLVAAAALYGLWSLANVALAVATALATRFLLLKLRRREVGCVKSHLVLMAVLLALTFPPGVSWHVVCAAAALTALLAQIFGGFGRFWWHPMLVARAIVGHFFARELLPTSWPVLKKASVLFGAIDHSETLPANIGWLHSAGSPEIPAWSGPRPVEMLSRIYDAARNSDRSAAESVTELIRDQLPPAADCLAGVTGGGIGETCVAAILLGGFFLIYRGHVRWTLPFGALLGVLVAAAVLPIPDGEGGSLWWPIRLVAGQPSLPVGLVLVGYHLLVGELALAVFFIAAEPACSPRRSTGQLCFGLGIGVLTVVMRYWGMTPGETYWAVLIMSTFVPLIDRLTRRRGR